MRSCPTCGASHERSHTYCLECHLAYNRQWRAEHPGRIAARKNPGPGQRGTRTEWRVANPEKLKAHKAVYYALKKGHLTRPDACAHCGHGRPQAHHEDYSRPLEVMWLCQTCHQRKHHEAREGVPA